MTEPEPSIVRRLVAAACSMLSASWIVTSSAAAAGGCGGEGDGPDAAADHRMSTDSGQHALDAARRDVGSVRVGTVPKIIPSPPDGASEAEAGFLAGRPEVLCAQDSGTIVAPEASSSIVDASVQSAASLVVPSDGDLWPSCWSGNALYAAWGDGFGFSEAGAYPRPSIGVARILGDPSAPDAMTGQTLAHDDEDDQAMFKVWTPGSYYQKPTGMLCLPGRMFIAVQDLNYDTYGDAPAATIAVSIDSGQTWVEDPIAPMFDNHEFTTVMFLDYGHIVGRRLLRVCVWPRLQLEMDADDHAAARALPRPRRQRE
jgi:hypothetical protein